MNQHSEYLVEIEIDTGDLDSATVGGLRAAEAVKARELSSQGSILSLWRVPGRWANLGLWSAPNESALMELIDSLPLRPYMSVQVRPLEPHPSDPRDGCAQPPRSAEGLGASRALSPLPDLELRRRAAPARANRRGELELTSLPELPVRRRPPSKVMDNVGAVHETFHAEDPSSLPSFSQPERDTRPFTLWADADVTNLVKRSKGGNSTSLTELICSQSLATFATHPGLLNNLGAQGRDLRITQGQKGNLHAATVSVFPLNGTSASSPAAEVATPLLTITDSGTLGVAGYLAAGDACPLQLNIGPIVRKAVVRDLPGGGEGIQVRSVVRLVLNVSSQSASAEGAGSFLAALSARLDMGE